MALTTQLPAADKVRVVPLTLHTLLLALVKTTVPPPEAEAVNVSGVPTVPAVGGEVQVMVCAVNPAVTAMVVDSCGAAEWVALPA